MPFVVVRTASAIVLQAAFLAASLALPSLGATTVTFVPAGAIGSNVGHFYYYGRWERVQHRDGRFFGASRRTAAAGAVAIFTFEGCVVRLYGVRGPGGGHGIVTVDGTRYENADFYAARKEPQAAVFVSPVLPAGIHTLAITAMGDPRDLRRRSSYVNLTGADYR